MTQQPRPESRISSLEQRATTMEALIVELSSDTAEELKTIRQLLTDKTDFEEMNEVLKAVATKEDIAAVKEDITEIKEDIAEMKSLMQQLLQKPSE